MKKIIACIMAALMALSPTPLLARDYISQDQLDQAVVTDLPGRIGANYYRERDPENMASNAISQLSKLLADQTHLALGAIGGIATLGFIGVLSTPLAVIGAAAVGGLALMGVASDSSRGVPRGLSTPNLGHLGYGQSPNYGARSQTSGFNGTVFGWSSRDNSRYQVGSIGVSSAQRAPVHVNMQSPHVGNMMGRGYAFTNYDRGYSNVSPALGGVPSAGTAATPAGLVPFSPGSSVTSGPQNPYSSFNYASPQLNYFGFGYGEGQYYDRRAGETFSNFFPRFDGAGVQGGPRGTRGDLSYQPAPWWASTPYSQNWRMTQNAPASYLTQSGEYSGRGWSYGAPQGRLVQPPGWGGSGISPQGEVPSGSSYSGNYSASMMDRGMPADPFAFQFRQPVQGLDLGAGAAYSFGNAYHSAQIPNNFGINFAIQPGQVGSGIPPMSYGYSGPQAIAPPVNGVVYPGFSGGTPPQLLERAPMQPPMVNGMVRPVQPVPPQSGYVNTIANPQLEQQRQENLDVAQQNVSTDQKAFLNSAMAPASSKFDHTKLSELETLLDDAYSKLLKSIQTGDQEGRQKWFDEYQRIQREIQSLSR